MVDREDYHFSGLHGDSNSESYRQRFNSYPDRVRADIIAARFCLTKIPDWSESQKNEMLQAHADYMLEFHDVSQKEEEYLFSIILSLYDTDKEFKFVGYEDWNELKYNGTIELWQCQTCKMCLRLEKMTGSIRLLSHEKSRWMHKQHACADWASGRCSF